MSKPWAEYKREQRKRQKEQAEARERELNTSVFRKPFSDFMAEDQRSSFGTHYLVLGDSWWNFENDSGLEPHDPSELSEEDAAATFNSLGKAELVLGVLEDAARALAEDIAAYKRHEIEARIRDMQKSGLTGPDSKANLDDLEHLKKMRHRLTQRVRITRPQTRASGE